MIIHFALIPSVKTLWQSLFSRPSNGFAWSKNFHRGSITFYSRGTWALQKAIEEILDKRNQKTGRVWLPDYFCNEPVIPLRNRGLHLYFYPIKKDLTADWGKIVDMAEDTAYPDIFIFVHYFGFPGQTEKALRFCSHYGAELIEDCAHQIAPQANSGKNIMIFSPRKFFAIPDGGILLKPGNNSQETISNKDYSIVYKWLILRLTQKTMLLLGIPWNKLRQLFKRQGQAAVSFKRVHTNIFPNIFTLKLFSVVEKDLEIIIQKRRQNYIQLFQAINKIQGVKPLFASLPENVCPYMFPMIVQDNSESLIRKLQKCGIPASNWPDLPEEVLQNPVEHSGALWLKEHILLLPIHQKLGNKQIQYIANCLQKAI